ncbi:MAG TPA: hypothetical protein VE912_07595 [Bacteroidales bacterium]|nr:hypothetical protein [Bacteroidales bacterium]
MKKIIFLLISVSILFASCETIENREMLGSVLSKDEIDIQVIQEPAGSNTIVLKNNTPGIIPYWDWGTGWSNKNEAEVYIPFAGDYTVEFTAFCDGGTVTVNRDFSVASNDDSYFDSDPAWKGLTGGGSGKTWVWALDHPSGYIAGNGPTDCLFPAWWVMTPDGLNIPDALNYEFYMDLNGAANFELKNVVDGSVQKGVFTVDDPLKIGDVNYSVIEVLGGPHIPWFSGTKYHLTNLTDDELSVHLYNAYDVAVFKRKGFVY